MKIKSLFIAICIAASIFSAHATVWTVCNNAYSPGQFTNLQTAINTANNGDTIYVEPSPNDYASVNVPKKLYLFGGGGAPYTYQVNNRTILDGITFSNQTSFPVSISDGSQVEGFYLGGASINSNLSNITIIRNEFSNGAGVSVYGSDTNIVVANNIFNGGQVYMTSNGNNDNTVLIANNFFNSPGQQPFFENSSYQETGVQILNNIIYGNSTTFTNQGAFFRSMNNASVKNNIFYCQGGVNQTFVSGCSNCTMQNNITYSPNTTQTLPDAGNTGTGNINNTDPKFTAGPALYTVIGGDTLYGFNWQLTNASSGHKAGSDGTDIGIYGGPYPFPNFETLTRLPQMRFLEIFNPTIQPGGTLHVNVIGTTHN